ncbi:MAG: aminoacyl-tRNA hydrolase [Candidatus Peregrinibacteria bacterium]|nr:aminoacyl-tRNA hydrolase [Candidatus Peregrinibacteria bacterium]
MKPSLIIVGLGNPGASYERTRHNAGFRALDALSNAFGVGEWQEKQKFLSTAQEGRIVTVPILLVKPQTYMNSSGEAVQKLIAFYKLDPAQLLVVSDDVDLPLGTIRLRKKGGPGTHNGLKSIVERLGEGFPRVRLGLGTAAAGSDLAAWVLSVPPPEEEKVLQSAIETLPELVKKFVLEGAEQ